MKTRGRPARSRPPGHRAGWGSEWLLAALAALTVVVTAAVQASGRFKGTPGWLVVLLYCLAAALGAAAALIKRRSDRLQADREWWEQVDRLLALPLGPDARPPRLSTLNPYRLGTSPSRYGSSERQGDDPYVPRDSDAELDEALRQRQFVLIVGDSKAGKSRTAYEAACRLTRNGHAHDPAVLVPTGTAALAGLLIELDPPLDLQPAPALLWLDDLTEGELAGLTPDVLDRLSSHVIVLGSITVQRYDRVDASDSEPGRNARQALARARIVRLAAGLSEKEHHKAQVAYPEERFEAGIGEQLVAADQLRRRYDNARQGAEPHGWALVQAAIDWVRMDIGRPIRRSELAALYPLYLDLVRPTAEPKHDLTESLQWACHPVASRIALVQRVSDEQEPAYRPFDYLVALADGQDGQRPQPIPNQTWLRLSPLLTPAEIYRAALSASYRRLPLPAQSLFQQAIASGHPDAAPKAAASLGLLLTGQGEVEGARAAYQQAIDSGHPDAAPAAAGGLGVLLAGQGEVEGARAAYQQAIDSGNPNAVPLVAFCLGVLLAGQGEVEGARAAYQQAIDSGHPDAAPMAALFLGRLLAGQGEVEGARAAYQQAIDSGHPDDAPAAALGLGGLLTGQGEVEGARAAYQQAIDSGHPDAAPAAALGLGGLLAEQGEVEGARAAYQQAIDSGHPDAAPTAAYSLGVETGR